MTIALHAGRREETLGGVITHLWERVADLERTIQRLYLDRGFFSGPVIRWLHAGEIPFGMPVSIRGKQGGTRAWLTPTRTRKTQSPMHSPLDGSVTFQAWGIGTSPKGKYGRHGLEYQAYAVHKVPIRLRGVPDEYRKRFGIESSSRVKTQSRLRTSPKNPLVRLLERGIAFLLVDLGIYLGGTQISRPRKGGRLRDPSVFPFKTMLRFLRQAIDRNSIVNEAI